MDVLQLVQETLDASPLGSGGVRVYWGRRGDMDTGANPNEYVIYSQDDDTVTESADGGVLVRTATIAVRYYMSTALARSSAGRRLAVERINQIHAALDEAGFTFPDGWMELGTLDQPDFLEFAGKFDFSRVKEL